MLGFIVAFSGCAFVSASYRKTSSLSLPYPAKSGIKVTTSNGSISVTKGSEAKIKVIAKIKASTEERLEQVTIKHELDPSGRLALWADWPSKRKGNEGCSFEVQVPSAIGVSLQSSNGSLTIANLSGDAELRTSNGSIRVNGHDGPVKARSSNGSIRIDLESQTAGPIDAKTSNGAITLGVGDAFQGRLTCSTSNGKVSFDDRLKASVESQRRTSATFNFKNGPASTARTSNGSIRINRL